ncbi:MAG: GHKL domain-containing protein [Lachnospiraceae bacterium]|nr:GHKL domain-containing protein [Lachnospiraceae bacterium]
MRIYEGLLSAIFNLFGLYVGIRVIKLFLPVKVTNKRITILAYAGVWISNWFVYYFFNTQNLTTISLFVGLMLVTFIFFDGSAGKKLISVIVSIASGAVSENVIWTISKSGIIPVENELVESLCAIVAEFLVVLVIERYIHLERYVFLPMGGYINIIVLAIGSVILSEIIVLPECSNGIIMVGLGIISLMNVSTYYIYEKISESYRQNLEKAAMKRQMKMYKRQFEIIGQSQENLKSIRHDMKNHLSLIYTYLQNHEYEEACEYVERFRENIETGKEYVKTGNVEVDSILNYKLEHIDKKIGCKPQILIDVPSQVFMIDFDLNIILGNLLDNAIEALEKVEKKYLSIEVKFFKGALYISIYNSFDGKVQYKNQRFLSGKDENEKHGIGLINVNKIVKKYDGIMKFSNKDQIFGVDIIIYVNGV